MKIDSFANWIRYWFGIRFRTRISRTAIKWKRFKKKFYQPKKPTVDIAQRKAIDLYLVLLKNKDTNLIHSPASSTRVIESDYVWVTMGGQSNEYVLNIIDETRSTNAHSHEVHIPKEYGFQLMDEFDLEIEKRFRAKEAAKKRVIVDDLEKLISKINNQKK